MVIAFLNGALTNPENHATTSILASDHLLGSYFEPLFQLSQPAPVNA
jgi:hypothetical protein